MNWMKNGISIIIFALGCYVGVMLCLTITGCKDEVTGATVVPAKDCAENLLSKDLDKENDGISDDVENNNRNPIDGVIPHPLFEPDTTCNPNPSIANNSYNSGSLTGGINLPDETGGKDGYYHYLGTDPTDFDDWGTLDLINLIERTGKSFSVNPPIGTGDMSKKLGGLWTPDHPGGTHQNGTEVDVRYVRKDGASGENGGMLDIGDTIQFKNFDKAATIKLINSFIANGDVQIIFISSKSGIDKSEIIGFTIISYDGSKVHDNHFHVRIIKP